MQFVLWAFISLPLNICGTIFGRRFAAPRKLPTRVNPMVRPIPDKPWYSSPWVSCLQHARLQLLRLHVNGVFCWLQAVILASGLLPFGSIFIETYFVFSSFWNYKFYYVYGFMLVVFTILAIVVSCVTIVATYFWLNSEGLCRYNTLYIHTHGYLKEIHAMYDMQITDGRGTPSWQEHPPLFMCLFTPFTILSSEQSKCLLYTQYARFAHFRH